MAAPPSAVTPPDANASSAPAGAATTPAVTSRPSGEPAAPVGVVGKAILALMIAGALVASGVAIHQAFTTAFSATPSPLDRVPTRAILARPPITPTTGAVAQDGEPPVDILDLLDLRPDDRPVVSLREQFTECEALLSDLQRRHDDAYRAEVAARVVATTAASNTVLLAAIAAIFALLARVLRSDERAWTLAGAAIGALLMVALATWQIALSSQGGPQSGEYRARHTHVRQAYARLQRRLDELLTCADDIAHERAIAAELEFYYDERDDTNPSAATEAFRRACPRDPAAVWLPEETIATSGSEMTTSELLSAYLAPRRFVARVRDRAAEVCVLGLEGRSSEGSP